MRLLPGLHLLLAARTMLVGMGFLSQSKILFKLVGNHLSSDGESARGVPTRPQPGTPVLVADSEKSSQVGIRLEFPSSRKRGLSGNGEGRIHVAAIPSV